MIDEYSITVTSFEYCRDKVLVEATTNKGTIIRLKIKVADLNWIMGKFDD